MKQLPLARARKARHCRRPKAGSKAQRTERDSIPVSRNLLESTRNCLSMYGHEIDHMLNSQAPGVKLAPQLSQQAFEEDTILSESDHSSSSIM